MTLVLLGVGLVWYSAVGYAVSGLIDALGIAAEAMRVAPSIPEKHRRLVAVGWPLLLPVLGFLMYRVDQQREQS